MINISSLLLVGCGKMGGALLDGWKRVYFGTHFHIIEPHHAGANDAYVTWHKNLDSLPENFVPDVIVFAVKPQQLEATLPDYHTRFAKAHPLYISIAAGKTLEFYRGHLGEHVHIVRAMPNTPALIGKGMTVLCANSTLSASARKIATDLMETVGKVEWLDSESLMDAVTAISGCGPAYVFLFLQSLVEAGVAAGLPEALAKSLAAKTVHGSLHLAENSAKSYEELRVEVASPGGATEAALQVLMEEDALKTLLERAVLAARNRSEELN